MLYEIPETAPRRQCRACKATIVILADPSTGRHQPVSVATRMTHFADCTDPARFRRRRHYEPILKVTPAPAGTQRSMFE